MAMEIELKLETDEAGLTALLALDPDGSGWHQEALLSTYYDTPSQALRRAGVSLRIRREGDRLRQAIKFAEIPAAALFARSEREEDLAGPDPEIPPDSLVAAILAEDGGQLTPAFEIAVRRSRCQLSRGSTRIELALDEAEARAGGKTATFREVELELLGGEPAMLFDLARDLDAMAPLRIVVLSKAERGYRLLADDGTAAKGEPVRLRKGDTIEQALLVTAAACIRQYRLNENLLLGQIAPEPVHQARVALRRLRTALGLFKPAIAGKRATRLNRGLRELAASLGEVRDLDVLMALAGPGELQADLATARDKAAARLARTLHARSTRRLMLELAEWLAVGKWRRAPDRATPRNQPLGEFSGPALDRLRRKVRKHGRHLDRLPEEQRHRLRKDAKRLRYALDMLGMLHGHAKRQGRFTKALRKLQDALGALNDAALAAERLAALGLAGSAEAERLLSATRTEGLIEQAVRARHELFGIDPFWR